MKARKEIIERLNSKSRKAETPEAWVSQREFESLPEQFSSALKAVKGEVVVAENLNNAWDILDGLLNQLSAKKIVITDEMPVNQVDYSERFGIEEWHLVGKSEGNHREFCASADVSITSADGALAETGSIIISTGSGRSRAASLLPPVHIALVSVSKLLPDIFSWTAKRKNEFPSQIVLISGPSKTADIEQTLVVGVHGPKQFIVILYSEDDIS
jgi:L-lactate dehydrogenase complex protein LldG